ncbi:MAG: cytochrome c oxidase subunit II, partial [Chloroflexota bacterium]|nr:cytochrome c oxidase subunit II [Chloroflexota bacterium]
MGLQGKHVYPKQLRGRPGGLIAAGLLVAALLLALSACSSPQTTFDPKSDAADKIQTLYILIIVVSGAIGAAVLVAMAYLMVKFRRRPGVKARQIHGNNTLEVLWTIGPILILVMIGVPTILAIVGAARAPADDALHVEVVAHQWWWEVNYPGLGPDGDDLITANELRLPIGREVAISLKSDDVIHSFWVPQLIGKIDSIPGRTNPLEHFTASEVGV